MTTFSKEIEDAIADASKEAYWEGCTDGYNACVEESILERRKEIASIIERFHDEDDDE